MEIVHNHKTADKAPGQSALAPRLFGAAVLLGVVSVAGLAAHDWWTSDETVQTAPANRSSASARIVDGLDPGKLVVTGPGALRDVSSDDARAINAAMPVAKGVNPEAAAFTLPTGGVGLWTRSVDCMTAAIYYEAAMEPVDGQRAVAQVVLNRMRHPVYPHSVCGVVFEGAERTTGCQFTFSCDGSLARRPVPTLWDRARKIAMQALSGYVYAPVGWSTHYHADYVAPYWAPSLTKVAVIGRHIFYRWAGRAGTPPAFLARYDGQEPDVWSAAAGLMTADGMVAGAPATDVAMADRPILAQSGMALPAGTAEADGAVASAGASSITGRANIRPLADLHGGQVVGKGQVPSGSRWILSGPVRSSSPAPVAKGAKEGVATVLPQVETAAAQ